MLILVIILFLICWGSRLSMEISIKVGLDTFSHEMYVLRIAINLLPYIHSCINPFIYSLMSKNFRRSMLRRWQRLSTTCCRSCCCRRWCCRDALRRRCFCRRLQTGSPSSSPCPQCNSQSQYNQNQFTMQVLSTNVRAIVNSGSQTVCRNRNPASVCRAPPADAADAVDSTNPLLRRHQSLYSASERRIEDESCISSV